MIFFYKFKDENRVVRKGSVDAKDKEAAENRLSMMSIQPLSIWADGDPEPDANVQSEGIEAKPPDAFFKDQEELFKQQEKAAKNLPAGSYKPVLSDGPDVKLGEVPSNPQQLQPQMPPVPKRDTPKPQPHPNVRDFAAPLPSKKQLQTACPRRTQTFLFGEHTDLSTSIKQYLANQNGRVLHLCMQPDIKGKLQLALVIEHDQEQET